MMLAIAGDSAAGKTTFAAGLAEALGTNRCALVSTDDYHRYDRAERHQLSITPLLPKANYIDIMEQHLQLLASGQPVLKPVYDHATGHLVRPELIEPREFVIVDGLLPLHTKLARACFDVTVYLDPEEEVRRSWKVRRDTASRGYNAEQVVTELAAREADSERYIRPQRAHADLVVRFAHVDGRADPPGTPLSAELLLRSTIPQPDLAEILDSRTTGLVHLRLARDTDGRPVDSLHVHGYGSPEDGAAALAMLWAAVVDPSSDVPDGLGRVGPSAHSLPLAVGQVLLLHHLLAGAR
ncbi:MULTISPECIES: phosphoribulokinase [Pseudonocardia]|uniref:phosphoribulokinase n=2 Tax=Pseudonocardia TaxID=1847 RepID=A0A1Y2MHV3_PSEAH|nr:MULTISPECIES: phosphoribulokinase [Pseudonocardia]OSY34651.1 Phosphoribulokinase [Pseudonocardia autotrophica]TDN76415.1 phosphoribulokinase [Pseudonocardia autotrophica]